MKLDLEYFKNNNYNISINTSYLSAFDMVDLTYYLYLKYYIAFNKDVVVMFNSHSSNYKWLFKNIEKYKLWDVKDINSEVGKHPIIKYNFGSYIGLEILFDETFKDKTIEIGKVTLERGDVNIIYENEEIELFNVYNRDELFSKMERLVKINKLETI